MGIRIAEELSIDKVWVDSEQPVVFDKNMIIGKTLSWSDSGKQEGKNGKQRRPLRKVSKKG